MFVANKSDKWIRSMPANYAQALQTSPRRAAHLAQILSALILLWFGTANGVASSSQRIAFLGITRKHLARASTPSQPRTPAHPPNRLHSFISPFPSYARRQFSVCGILLASSCGAAHSLILRKRVSRKQHASRAESIATPSE